MSCGQKPEPFSGPMIGHTKYYCTNYKSNCKTFKIIVSSNKHNLAQMQNTNNKKDQGMNMIKREEHEYTPKEGFVLTHFLTVEDVKRSTEFYIRILGGKVIRSGEP